MKSFWFTQKVHYTLNVNLIQNSTITHKYLTVKSDILTVSQDYNEQIIIQVVNKRIWFQTITDIF